MKTVKLGVSGFRTSTLPMFIALRAVTLRPLLCWGSTLSRRTWSVKVGPLKDFYEETEASTTFAYLQAQGGDFLGAFGKGH